MPQANPILRVNAGPLTAWFDLQRAFLRHVRIGDTEIVRGVFAAVRDRDWNTIPFSIHDLQVDSGADHFALSFLAKCSQDDVQFDWRGEVTGTADGVIRFRFDGRALRTFLKNRIGLCVLHPIAECAGRPCRVEHVDGSVTDGRFPERISPDQPFKSIRSITHGVDSRAKVKVTFDGETFEMEDQRNWTDASFKTYSTPLELPFPVEVPAGSRIEHVVTIELCPADSVTPASPALAEDADDDLLVRVDWQRNRRLPHVGFSMATIDADPSEDVVRRLREIGPDHLRVDLHLQAETYQDRLAKAVALAGQVDAKLEIALFAEDAAMPAWQQCLALLDSERERIARWLVFQENAKATPPDLAVAARQTLRAFAPTIPIVVGTDAYFAELNRNRPPVDDDSLVCYSINPQVHAFDNLSLAETLGAHQATVDSAQAIFNCPVVISPVTLKPRFNPNATSEASTVGEPETDERQTTGFAASWTVGALAQLATHPGVASVTFYETFGPRGLLDVDAVKYPVFSVFETLQKHDKSCAAVVSRPLDVAAIGLLQSDDRRGLLLGNLSNGAQTIVVQVGDEREVRLTLDPETVRYLDDEALR